MSLHDHTAATLDGQPANLADYKGQVVLVVNVASRCGLTPQYAGLEALYPPAQGRGGSPCSLPCNQFAARSRHGGESPPSARPLRRDLPVMAKVTSTAPTPPLFNELTRASRWLELRQVLIGRDGR
jgi:glutathione peroxidase